MPGWTDILAEFNHSTQLNNGIADADAIRRRYLLQLAATTGRSTILYYTNWFNHAGNVVSINPIDMQGMMEACRDLPGPALDILLHSPGGTATESSGRM